VISCRCQLYSQTTAARLLCANNTSRTQSISLSLFPARGWLLGLRRIVVVISFVLNFFLFPFYFETYFLKIIFVFEIAFYDIRACVRRRLSLAYFSKFDDHHQCIQTKRERERGRDGGNNGVMLGISR